MRLELGKFPVTEVEFGDKTAWTDGKLEIDRAGLTSKILEDPRVLSADFDLARPGDSVSHHADQGRYRADGQGKRRRLGLSGHLRGDPWIRSAAAGRTSSRGSR